MWIVTILVLLAGGLLGAAGIIVAKNPGARKTIDALEPFKGFIGLVLLVWGIVDLVNILRALSVLGSFYGIIFLLVMLTELGLGFLLSYELLSKYLLSRSAGAEAKGAEVRARLAGYQGPLGLLAIALAIVFLALSLKH